MRGRVDQTGIIPNGEGSVMFGWAFTMKEIREMVAGGRLMDGRTRLTLVGLPVPAMQGPLGTVE